MPLEAERGEGYSPHDPEAFAKMEPHPTGARYDTTTVFSTKRGIQRGKHQVHFCSSRERSFNSNILVTLCLGLCNEHVPSGQFAGADFP